MLLVHGQLAEGLAQFRARLALWRRIGFLRLLHAALEILVAVDGGGQLRLRQRHVFEPVHHLVAVLGAESAQGHVGGHGAAAVDEAPHVVHDMDGEVVEEPLHVAVAGLQQVLDLADRDDRVLRVETAHHVVPVRGRVQAEVEELARQAHQRVAPVAGSPQRLGPAFRRLVPALQRLVGLLARHVEDVERPAVAGVCLRHDADLEVPVILGLPIDRIIQQARVLEEVRQVGSGVRAVDAEAQPAVTQHAVAPLDLRLALRLAVLVHVGHRPHRAGIRVENGAGEKEHGAAPSSVLEILHLRPRAVIAHADQCAVLQDLVVAVHPVDGVDARRHAEHRVPDPVALGELRHDPAVLHLGHHVEQPGRLLHEALRLLQPAGEVLRLLAADHFSVGRHRQHRELRHHPAVVAELRVQIDGRRLQLHRSGHLHLLHGLDQRVERGGESLGRLVLLVEVHLHGGAVGERQRGNLRPLAIPRHIIHQLLEGDPVHGTLTRGQAHLLEQDRHVVAQLLVIVKRRVARVIHHVRHDLAVRSQNFGVGPVAHVAGHRIEPQILIGVVVLLLTRAALVDAG